MASIADPLDSSAQVHLGLDPAGLTDQRGRLVQLHSALPGLALIPERVVAREGISHGFELALDCLSTSAYLEVKKLIGEQVTVGLMQSDGRYRPLHGHVFEALHLGSDGGWARYRLVVRDWTAFLEQRIDSFLFQDMTVQQIVEDILRDHPQSNVRFCVADALQARSLCCQFEESDIDFMRRLLAEEGLSWHIEHLDAIEAPAADTLAQQARHVVVINSRGSARRSIGEVRFAPRLAWSNVPEQREAVTHFSARRSVQAHSATQASWDYRRVTGHAASEASLLDPCDAPSLEYYDGSGACRFGDVDAAAREASLSLAALQFGVECFEGQGGNRHFEAGACFELVGHPLYGASGRKVEHARALGCSRERGDSRFTLVSVEHHATNNLGAKAAVLLGQPTLERGGYHNHFHAVPAAAPIVPPRPRKPTAPGSQTAIVVGVPGEPLTTDRDHRNKLQFPWQRGCAPLTGGLAHDERSADPKGNAPGDHRSGAWVRVALPAAGANWGTVFTPRVGAEVAVAFIEGDIDRPLVTGFLHNGQDMPPFSAGAESGVNHAGVISGLHSPSLDGPGFNQWVVDDATGQLRMRLHCTYSTAELGLGHLIRQTGSSAERGACRGSGFEAGTQAWACLRAGQGLLLSSNGHPVASGCAQGTQMGAAEALARMRQAQALGQQLSDAASAAGADALSSLGASQALETFADSLDLRRKGRHAERVNGQRAQTSAEDGRTPGEPVDTFGQPVLLMDTPAAALFATDAAITRFAGLDMSVIAESDVHQAAAHTYSGVSGQATSLYTHGNGIRAVAANGPVSLRAHADGLQIFADREIICVSLNDEIHINAGTRIELAAADSRLLLEGSDITITTPGAFEAKGAEHTFLPGARQDVAMPALPAGSVNLLSGQVVATDAIGDSAAAGTPQPFGGAADGV